MIHLGVSACYFYPDPKREVSPKKNLLFVEMEMLRYLYRPNVIPVMIPDLPREEQEEFLGRMDAFLLQGGVDVCPETYGAEYLDREKWPGDCYRDKYDLNIVAHARAHKKPILGICRGCQILNVGFGGTLYQDLQLEHPGAELHRCAHVYDRVYHDAKVEPGGFLSRVYPGHDVITINSVHHQGIKDVGEGLRVEATSMTDGVIECVSSEDGLAIGVQWHPEFSHTLGDLVVNPVPLLEAFYALCSTK